MQSKSILQYSVATAEKFRIEEEKWKSKVSVMLVISFRLNIFSVENNPTIVGR